MTISDYTEAEAAHELNRSPRTLAKWRKAGLIPYSIDFSGRIGYTLGQVAEIAQLCRRLPAVREPGVIR